MDFAVVLESDPHYKEYKDFTRAYLAQDKVGNISFLKTLEKFQGDIEKMWLSLRKRVVGEREGANDHSRLHSDDEIPFKCIWESDYPFSLREIHNPPVVIYYNGIWDCSIFDKTITIVGTRHMSAYGDKFARKFATEFTNLGFTIVSGLATGVDAAAQEAAVDSAGRTISVLPATVNKAIPASNQKLFDKILENKGLIISEYEKVKKMEGGLFAHRNRIIAGLSKVTIVIEAPENSGALITANIAFDSNREVFALPGNIDNKNSFGCNKLIASGKAKLLQNIADVLIEYGIEPNVVNLDKSIRETLASQEKDLYDILMNGSKSIEELIKLAKIDVSLLSSMLTRLELRSVVARNLENKFTLI